MRKKRFGGRGRSRGRRSFKKKGRRRGSAGKLMPIGYRM